MVLIWSICFTCIVAKKINKSSHVNNYVTEKITFAFLDHGNILLSRDESSAQRLKCLLQLECLLSDPESETLDRANLICGSERQKSKL